MSINVTVHSNPVNINRGRMVLSDLSQIKKNERDRRRRLRLVQVREQSKVISNRLVERVKNLTKQEMNRMENDTSSSLRKHHDRKIMDMQQKFEEELADIGYAHTSAALQPDTEKILEEEKEVHKTAAAKRGKEAFQLMKEAQEKSNAEAQAHQERLRQVRDLENVRSSMITKLPQKIVEENSITVECTEPQLKSGEMVEKSSKKRKEKRLMSKKSPRKVAKSYKTGHSPVTKLKSPTISSARSFQTDTPGVCNTQPLSEANDEDNAPRKTVPLSIATPMKVDKAARYNPEDYTQPNIESTASDSSETVSDDSSYFSDSSEKYKRVQTPKYVKCPGQNKVRVYDHNSRQTSEYTQPIGIVEKIDVRNEPSAIDLAKEVTEAERTAELLAKNRKLNALRRGEDALLREKVRRDYQNLVQNLDQFSKEERKLNAAQVQRHSKDVNPREERRRMMREHHKKRLDNTIRTIFHPPCSSESSSRPTERIITLKPKEREGKCESPCAVWQDSCYYSAAESKIEETDICESIEKSREEQILDMLKKVERQKRLLLQEFGADLPDDIFNASVKSLFEQSKSVTTPPTTSTRQPVSPEIKVINLSNNEEESKNKTANKKKPSIDKVEIAVQTVADKSTVGEDKGVQVEVTSDSRHTYHVTSTDNDGRTMKKYHEPLEPKVTVISHEVNSSPSSSSTIEGVHIDIENENVQVTPNKKKTAGKSSRRVPSKHFQKSRSMPASKVSTPVKRISKSLPGSCQNSPKKTSRNVCGTPSKKIDIYVNKNGLNIKVEPSPKSKTCVDASTQSSQVCTTEFQEHSANKPYKIQTQLKRIIKIRDTSDTSTSYASLPPIRPRTLVEAFTSNTPILEMLDSSTNECLEKQRREVSPVSTPETPSPRTMMLPSNVLRPDRINKMLKYTMERRETNNSTTLSSSKNDRSTSTDPSDLPEPRMSMQYPSMSSDFPGMSSDVCSCRNPECKFMHGKIDEVHAYALKNCPEILKKYEDLKSMCTERIASLTDLIQRVRNEQRGMEFSTISPGDETSYMELPSEKHTSSELQSVQRLVQNIEAIHNELAKTLKESQRIREKEEALEEGSEPARESIVESIRSADMSRDTTVYLEPKFTMPTTKDKPKIISDERVNIELSRFLNLQQKPQEEDMIEKLSKEILEQSAGLSKAGILASTFKDSNTSLNKYTVQGGESSNQYKNDSVTSVTCDANIQQQKSDNHFIPFLAGIPKVPRSSINTNTVCGRGKPPVTLHNPPFRTEIESSGHELSTIAEFDTPDTANKSRSTKSPSPIKKSADTQVKSSIVKPSVHVAPLLPLHNDLVGEKSRSYGKSLSARLPSTHRSQETVAAPNFLEKPKTPVTPEKSDKKLQCDTGSQGTIIQTDDKQLLSSTRADHNDQWKDTKGKITSSSSNSLSGLSGISEITSTPSSEIQKYISSPEEMETALEKLGLVWAITVLKKTRAASALSSSSNSDMTPINTARRMISPPKKQLDSNAYNLPDFSDVSSISIKEASKSTEKAVLLKGRTSTPKLQQSNSNSGNTNNSSSTNSSDNVQEPSDSLIVPNISLTKVKPAIKQLENF